LSLALLIKKGLLERIFGIFQEKNIISQYVAIKGYWENIFINYEILVTNEYKTTNDLLHLFVKGLLS
jgi:hypothetical protein